MKTVDIFRLKNLCYKYSSEGKGQNVFEWAMCGISKYNIDISDDLKNIKEFNDFNNLINKISCIAWEKWKTKDG